MEDLGVHVFQVLWGLIYLKGKIALEVAEDQLFYTNSRYILGNRPINVGEQAY